MTYETQAQAHCMQWEYRQGRRQEDSEKKGTQGKSVWAREGDGCLLSFAVHVNRVSFETWSCSSARLASTSWLLMPQPLAWLGLQVYIPLHLTQVCFCFWFTVTVLKKKSDSPALEYELVLVTRPWPPDTSTKSQTWCLKLGQHMRQGFLLALPLGTITSRPLASGVCPKPSIRHLRKYNTGVLLTPGTALKQPPRDPEPKPTTLVVPCN